ncbi:MAG: hypothetical protein JSV19_08980 [Phycisphaerales bacterium]|nr:MAG: hypothetical protein JSV19_08980 [Phycisphaerales bacterium]
MTKLRITPDGTIRGLWDDRIGWPDLGRVSVRRVSHVEFCDRRQMWYVRAGVPTNRLRRLLQLVLRRPFGEIMHWAGTRQEALAREQQHFEPGGPGWSADITPGSATCPAGSARTVPREELQ